MLEKVSLNADSNESILASSNLNEVQKIISDLTGLQVRLWIYRVSHCVLELRFAHCSSGAVSNRFNTIVGCAGTRRILIGTSAWKSNLILTSFEDASRNVFLLQDKKANVLIECDNVGVQTNMPAKFFGL